MKTQLYLSKGDFDFQGNEVTEDRFILVDANGMDLLGEHFSYFEAWNLALSKFTQIKRTYQALQFAYTNCKIEKQTVIKCLSDDNFKATYINY